MPTYILLSLLAAVCFSLTGIFNKVASKHSIANKWEIIFYYYAVRGLGIMIILAGVIKISLG